MDGAGWGRGGEEPFLAKLPPGPHRLPRELVRDNQRRRILLAALEVFSERGFAATTVKDLIGRARVSRSTFYEVFADKGDCFATLHEDLLAWLSAEVAAAVDGSADWSAKVRAGVVRTVGLLAAEPRIAAICAVEAPASTEPRVRSRHQQVVESLCRGLRAGRDRCRRGEDLPEVLEPALICGAIYMIGRSVAESGGRDARDLGPELAELMLVPYGG